MKLTLYTGPQCSLCDLALDIITQYNDPQLIVEKVNIRESNELYHLYGAKIPVLKNQADGRELNWPFDITTLQAFIH